MPDINRFVLREDHITLLASAIMCWNDCEYGAPCIDPKRPYGNSSGSEDVCRVLGWEKLGDNGDEPCFSSVQRKKARAIHEETETALEVILQSRSFVCGEYTRPVRHGISRGPWQWSGVHPA